MVTRARTPPTPLRPGSSLLYDVFVLARSVQELLAADLRDTPLTAEEYAVYSHVFETRRTTPTAMSRALGVPPTTVSDWLRTMTARGHISRTPSPHDGRSWEIRLTQQGRLAHRATNRRFEQAYARFRAGLVSPEAELHSSLTELITAAQSATAVRDAQNVSAGT